MTLRGVVGTIGGGALLLGGCALAYDLESYSGGGSDPPPVEAGQDEVGADGAAPFEEAGAQDALAQPDSPGACTVQASIRAPSRASASSGGAAWTSPTEARAEDGISTITTLALAGDESQLLRLDDFGFAVPAGAAVQGVRVEIRARASAPDPLEFEDRDLELTPGGTPSGDDLATAKLSGAFVTREYGGPQNLWGLALTPAIVNAPSFGVAYSVRYKGGGGGGGVEVDVLRVSVSYCE